MFKIWPRSLLIIIMLLILISLLIASLPTLMSTDWGRRQTVYWIGRLIPGKVEVRQLHLQWSKGQTVEGFLLKDPEGNAVLEFKRFTTDATLWQLIKKSTCLGFTQIQGLNATINVDKNGQTNLQKTFGLQNQSQIPSIPTTISLSNIDVDSYLFTPRHPLSIQIKGFTQQGHLNGSFEAKISLDGLPASNWREFQEEAEKYFNTHRQKEAKIQAQIVNFPIEFIDHLVGLQNPNLNGLFHSMLGNRLNLDLHKEPSEEGLAFSLNLSAPLMQGEIKGILIKNMLTLMAPSALQLNLLPESLNPLIGEKIELNSPSHIEIVFSDLCLSLNLLNQKLTVDPCLLGLKSEIKFSGIDLNIHSLGKFKISKLNAHLNSLQCDRAIQLEAIAEIEHDRDPFSIHFTSSLNQPIPISRFFQDARESMSLNFTLSHLPLKMIPIFQHFPEWNERIGPYINAQLELKPQDKKEWKGTFSFQTPQLVLKEAVFNIGEEINLQAPAQFKWKVPSNCLQTWFSIKNATLGGLDSLEIRLKSLKIPLNDYKLMSFEWESYAPYIRISQLVDGEIIQFDDFSFQLKGKELIQLQSDLSGKISLLNETGHLSLLTRDSLTFKQTSNWKIQEEGDLKMLSQVQLDNSMMHFQVDAMLHSNGLLQLTRPIYMDYILSPHVFENMGHFLHKESWPKLQDHAHFKLHVDPTEFNLKSFSLSQLHLQGMLEIQKIVLQDVSGEFPILENITIPWVMDASQNIFSTDIKGTIYTQKDKKPTPISSHLQVSCLPGHYDLAHTKGELRMNFTRMPTSILNILIGTTDLTPLIGPIIDLNLKTFFDPTIEKPGYFDIVLDSTNFHVEGRLKLEQNVTIYDPSKPPAFRFTLTPESYQYLNQVLNFKDERQLNAPFTMIGTFSHVDFPIKENWADQAAFDFKFFTDPIQWLNIPTSDTKLKGHIFTQQLKDSVSFSAQLQMASPLSIEGDLTHLVDQNNRLNQWEKIGIRAKLNGQQLNPLFFENLVPLEFGQKQKLQALFGKALDIHASFRLENLDGPIQASIKGELGYIQLDGQIEKATLFLNQPLEGSLNITPLFLKAFFASDIPFLNTLTGAENPITFKIEPSQFLCPLFPFQLAHIQIEKSSLNLGKLQLRNEGEIQSILNLIHPISDSYLTIWFTPILMKLKEGSLSFERFDMLVSQAYTLANWGSINLLTHQGSFVLGIPAQTLKTAFGVQGLSKEYILQVPFFISEKAIKLDKKRVVARMSALIAQSHGGSKGKVLGSIMDTVLSDKEEIYPSPTTYPFPWEGTFDSSLDSSIDSPIIPPAENQPKKKPSKEKTDEEKNRKKSKGIKQDSLDYLQEGILQIFDR